MWCPRQRSRAPERQPRFRLPRSLGSAHRAAIDRKRSLWDDRVSGRGPEVRARFESPLGPHARSIEAAQARARESLRAPIFVNGPRMRLARLIGPELEALLRESPGELA